MKIIEIADFHVAPDHIEESIKDIERVCEIAMSEKVDAIVSAGDFFHRAMLATDKNKYGEILELADRLQNAAQVFFVNGTPSHDSPGTYSAFKKIGWKELSIGKSHTIGDLLLLGMPEITSSQLMARFPDISKQDIIAKQYELVNQVIDEYYKPLAMGHEGPVMFTSHGHVAGSKFRDDQKPRTSDFMFSEDMLKPIHADRYLFGHLHLWQKFKTICGEYPGSAHITWGDVGFKAGFNVVEFLENDTKITRFHYNKPERQKIVIKDIDKIAEKINSIRTGADVWVDIECDKAFSDEFDRKAALEDIRERFDVGPQSKVTCNIQHEEHVRIDTDEYEACKTTEDLYKLYDAEATPSILQKVKEAEEATHQGSVSVIPHRFEFLDLYLRGSKFGIENGVEEFRMDWKDFETGANLIIGKNGTGKTFSLGFCNPFSEHLPTGSDLKSLFSLKDSQIIRRWRDGEDIITQKILIDPTLAAPSAKYYMDKNGEAFPGVTGTKTPFDSAVLDLFGTVKMFMACVFRGQKEHKDHPTLENASEKDLRQIFTELLGIDRTPVKKYAHDKVSAINAEAKIDWKEIDTMVEAILDGEALRTSRTDKQNQLTGADKSLISLRQNHETLSNKISAIDTTKSENKIFQDNINTLEVESSTAQSTIRVTETSISEVNLIINNAEVYREELKLLNKKKESHTDYSGRYFTAQGDYNKLVTTWMDNKEAIEITLKGISDGAEKKKVQITDLRNRDNSIAHEADKYSTEINLLNIPCEHCLKLSSTADTRITDLSEFIKDIGVQSEQITTDLSIIEADLEVERVRYKKELKGIGEKPKPPETIEALKIEMESFTFNAADLAALEKKVSGLEASEQKKAEYESLITQKRQRIEEIDAKIKELFNKIKPVDNDEYNPLVDSYHGTTRAITIATTEIGRLTAEIEALRRSIEKNDNGVVVIAERREKVAIKTSEASEWSRIESAWSPKGIPAMELSLIAPIIDREANRLLSIYGDRYKTQIITQDLNSHGDVAEKFKILIHDTVASEPKNLPVTSGGQSVWSTKALQESISMVAGQRNGRVWLYSIMDEVDGALDSDIIAKFYELMQNAMDGRRKLVSVSHSSEAKAAVSSIKNITEFMVNYGE